MASSARYHLLPEEGRPSIDTIADDSRPLIDIQNTFSFDEKKTKVGFADVHVTLYLRIIAFIFFLAGTIVLGIRSVHTYSYWYVDRSAEITSVVFLSIALARNALVIFSYFVNNVVKISINIQIRGQTKSKPRIPAWLKGKLFGIVLDLSLILALFCVLIVGLVRSSHYNSGILAGFIVAIVGM